MTSCFEPGNSSIYNDIGGQGNKDVLESSLHLRRPPEPPMWQNGAANGIVSCTESLGFESCGDDWMADDNDDDDLHHRDRGGDAAERGRKISNCRRIEKKKMEFPPPMKRCFLFQAVREDGRLKIRQVEIQRPEILRAFRQNGRLRLHFVTDNYHPISDQSYQDVKEGEEDQEPKANGTCQQLDVDHHQHVDEDVVDEVDIGDDHHRHDDHCQDGDEDENCVDDGGDDDDGDEWRIKRCHELVMNGKHHYHHRHYNHHDMQLWSQWCVTTR